MTTAQINEVGQQCARSGQTDQAAWTCKELDFWLSIEGGKVFPLRQFREGDAASKAPLHAGWQARDYSRDELIVYAERGHSLAWAPLGSGVIVVDVDVANDERPDKLGRASLQTLANEHECDLQLIPTCNVSSPTGGMHIFLHLPEDVSADEIRKPARGEPLTDIDIQRGSKYVVLAGSQHWSGKGQYEWNGETAIAEIPGSLLKLIRRDEAELRACRDEAGNYVPYADRDHSRDGWKLNPVADFNLRTYQCDEGFAGWLLDRPGFSDTGESWHGYARFGHSNSSHGDNGAGVVFEEGIRTFSSSIPGLDPETFYRPSEIVLQQDFDGVFAAFHAWLTDEGYGVRRTPQEVFAGCEEPDTESPDEADTEERRRQARERQKAHRQRELLAREGIPGLDNPLGRTDLANAQRTAALCRHKLRFVQSWDTWISYDKDRWAVNRQAGRRAGIYHAEWAASNYDQGDKKQAKHVERCRSASGISAAENLAKALPELQYEVPIDDQYPDLLNAANGGVNLKTRQLEPRDADRIIFPFCDVSFDPNACCVEFENAVATILPDPDVRLFMQRYFGLAITGRVEAYIAFLIGDGANGKSVLLDAITGTLGASYAYSFRPDLIAGDSRKEHPTEFAALHGKRLAVASELPKGGNLDAATVKRLTGNDRISARRMREDFWEFSPTHTFAIATNFAPKLRGDDEAMRRRLIYVPFDVRFWDGDKGETGEPHLKADKLLSQKLRTPEAREGILRWLVDGAKDYLAGGLRVPAAVMAATDGYWSSSDLFRRFVDERLTRTGNESDAIPLAELAAAFANWLPLEERDALQVAPEHWFRAQLRGRENRTGAGEELAGMFPTRRRKGAIHLLGYVLSEQPQLGS